MPPVATARLCVESMRPRQWHKNAFVLAGLVFAGRLDEPAAHARAWAAVGAFCLASGAAYLLNDVIDREGDRCNPRTARRPVARGALSPSAALAAAALTALTALAIGAVLDGATLAVLLAFCGLQVAYSIVLKRIVGADVVAIAGSFVLRALAGATAVDVPASVWLIACTALVAAFLALAKRRGELTRWRGATPGARVVLERYARLPLDQAVTLLAALTVAVYGLYCLLGPTGPPMLVTLPFVVFGVVRAGRLATGSAVAAEDPSLLTLTDLPLAACVVGWAVAAALTTQIAG